MYSHFQYNQRCEQLKSFVAYNCYFENVEIYSRIRGKDSNCPKIQLRERVILNPYLCILAQRPNSLRVANLRVGTGSGSRAGHATTLPRQTDHVFRSQKLLFIALCQYSLSLLYFETLEIFVFFLASETLYYVVALSLSCS